MGDCATRPTRLVRHDTALRSLLDALLAGVPTTAAPAAAGPQVPDWAAQDFRALLFRIGAYRFAMPLALLRSVGQMSGRLISLPAQPD